MDPKIIAAIVIVAVALLVALLVIWRRHRRLVLRQKFGPEYDRLVQEHGFHRAESVLEARQQRVNKFSLHSLTADQREQFISNWHIIQSRFVDDPACAVDEADGLLSQLMRACGYPMTDFEQRAADISVYYPQAVADYRAAHELALLHQHGQATTEDLRSSMIHYRTLFDELLATNSDNMKREVA